VASEQDTYFSTRISDCSSLHLGRAVDWVGVIFSVTHTITHY